jgi:hypothetical protein
LIGYGAPNHQSKIQQSINESPIKDHQASNGLRPPAFPDQGIDSVVVDVDAHVDAHRDGEPSPEDQDETAERDIDDGR